MGVLIMAPRPSKKLVRTEAQADPDELQAVEAAAAAVGVNTSTVYAVVTAWIMERWLIETGKRLPQQIKYDLNDAKMRGVVSACLGRIASELADLPPDVPFFDLSQEQVVDVFVVGLNIIREAVVSVQESPGGLDDPIPFGN